jgi:hypothetical protein
MAEVKNMINILYCIQVAITMGNQEKMATLRNMIIMLHLYRRWPLLRVLLYPGGYRKE